MNAVIYIHGKGGSAAEADHYAPLFPSYDVIGIEYSGNTPWEAGKELHERISEISQTYDCLFLIANSIGAFFSMDAGIERVIRKAYFISPIVDMEKLITDMMLWASVTEDELKAKGVRLIDEKPRRGAGGAMIAFIHPSATGGVLLELSQR